MSFQTYKCYYCDKVFSSNFMMKEHISYEHQKDKNIYKKIKELETIIYLMKVQIEEKTKIINSLEERLSKIENNRFS